VYIELTLNTKTTFEELENGVLVEKETIYIPEDQYTLSIGIQRPKWSIELTQNYFGKRLYKIGEAPLKDYSVYNLAFTYNVLKGRNELTASLHIQNIWNKNYQVMHDFAMPGRSIKFSLFYTLDFND
jgi:outer membrane cobalamin receptor